MGHAIECMNVYSTFVLFLNVARFDYLSFKSYQLRRTRATCQAANVLRCCTSTAYFFWDATYEFAASCDVEIVACEFEPQLRICASVTAFTGFWTGGRHSREIATR